MTQFTKMIRRWIVYAAWFTVVVKFIHPNLKAWHDIDFLLLLISYVPIVMFLIWIDTKPKFGA